ncbi:RNA recognition motif domain-containing protein [Pseudoalteromonas aurantia]|uniref:RNA-binding protein n=1 Tax=Pseudoalteromonas aurantia TaxID=43654 RepID=A0A5S3V590_9GAMM|nr:RNA-binding protein [Pseudoalteromonas aurantia]TMO61419.1 RNA-binding protein [Pseudoalteromonas aurantia]TMO66342.1 RNA-binding protein [Pseudoalteromonas aurantia]TMO76527.1 RNA-binding protein [Pseudoalteromonas aurantia]
MKSSDQKPFIITFALAVIGFLILQFVLSNIALSAPILFAAGILVGGFAVIFTSGEAQEAKQEVKTKTLYVGNLPYKANEGVVRELFSEQGQVFSVRLLKDKNTGKRRGFGFVEMAELDADKAISALNDQEFQQRTLKVRAAKQKQYDNEEEIASH